MNIFTYSVNLAGPYHIEKGIPCQDAFCIDTLFDTDVIAAIADGLGSAKHSDIGAKLAAESAIAYLKSHLTKDMEPKDICIQLKEAFHLALMALETKSTSDNLPLSMYDTTLCVAYYNGKDLYFGQSGDSGLIALFQDGSYKQVTTKQQDDMGRVYPLRFGPDYWVFDSVTDVTAAMLATDGVLDHIFHPLLAQEEIPLDVPLAQLFLEHHAITEEEAFDFVKDIYEFLENYPAEYINDDKTVVAMINKSTPPDRMSDDYYQGPSWKNIYKKFLKKGGTLHERIFKKWRAYQFIRTRISRWRRGQCLPD